MLKNKLLMALVVVAMLIPATAASASAATTTTAATLTTSARVLAVAKSIAAEAKWTLTGCVINKSMTEVLKVAKLGKAPSITIATAAVKAANAQGNGFCKATGVIAKTVAAMWISWEAFHKVYVKQTIARGSYPWSKLTITRWIGKDTTHTVKLAYTV